MSTLKVEAVQHTNGTSAMTIDSSGRVNFPQKPVFQGWFTGLSVSTSNYNPNLNTTFNRGFTITAASSRITVPITGVYYFYCQQLVSTAAVTAYLTIRPNGGATNSVYAYSDGDNTYDLVVASVFELTAGQYVDFFYSGTTTFSWGTPHSSVIAYLV